MNETADSNPMTCQEWDPSDKALQLDRFGDGTDGRRIVLLANHPSWPFCCTLADSNESQLQAMAFAYLDKLKVEFESRGHAFLPSKWMNALDPTKTENSAFGWLGINNAAAIASRKLTRKPVVVDDETCILVAGRAFSADISDGFGVRVVIRRLRKNPAEFAITSMTAHLPDNQYLDLAKRAGDPSFSLTISDLKNMVTKFSADSKIKAALAQAAGQDEDSINLTELRILALNSENKTSSFEIETVSYGSNSSLPEINKVNSRTHGFDAVVVRIPIIFHPEKIIAFGKSERVAKWPLHSDANVDVPVFKQVPTADPKVQAVPPYSYFPRPSHYLMNPDLREEITIDDTLENKWFSVRYCPDFVKNDSEKSSDDPYKVVLPKNKEIHPRSDLQSAISAFYAFDMFFKQVEELGLDPTTMLRYLKLPVQVHYRSGIAPGRGKDGNTVNARVSLVNQNGVNFIGDEISEAHVHLALANLNHWFRDIPNTEPLKAPYAQPLGIANSRRWVLHEIGHVLISGSLGELELRFVHSIGDALAAILCDPESRIASADPNGPWADFRFHTFPWVYANRRHDRTVLTGWSWSGTMHKDVLRTPELQLRGLKGYKTEQILSTTLFRLYRILGGDTDATDEKADAARRHSASLTVCYLMLRAIETFVHAPLRAEELECAMIDADVCLTTPLKSDGDMVWAGGKTHKVIRWAFEAQGLHPANATENNNFPGAPPPVDIYIKDRRNDHEPTFAGTIEHEAGSYVPVSLHWDARAKWTGGRLSLTNARIKIGDRGKSVPNVVEVKARAWWGQWVEGNEDVTWIQANLPNDDVTTRLDGTEFSLSDLGLELPDDVPQPANLLLLVEISCPEDRANTDPETHFDCAISDGDLPTQNTWEITSLVATDNNLALFWVDF